MDALSSSPTSKAFMDSFSYAQRGTGIRSLLGRFRILHRDKKWWQACKDITDFCDQHVEKALARQKSREQDQKVNSKVNSTIDITTTSNLLPRRLRLVDEIAEMTQDPIDLRYQILSAFSPAHDGAAIILSNTFFHLARHPDIWAKLRAEILPSSDQSLTYELLKSYKYLDHIFREGLYNRYKLVPPVPLQFKLTIHD